MLPFVAAIRELPGPTGFDILTSSVVVRTRSWFQDALLTTPAANVGAGYHSDSDLTIWPRPRVIEQGDGTLVLKIVQPASATGGYTPQQLVPPAPRQANVDVYWLVTAPDGITRKYVQARLVTDKAFHYSVVLSGRDLRPPH